MSSAVGMCSSAPRKRGVKTKRTCVHDEIALAERGWGNEEALTVSLNWVVCDATEHSEALAFVHLEASGHPREEVGQAEVATAHTLGNARAAAGEGQSAN